MTSAPNSASCVAQNGPARKLDTSMTRMPRNGSTAELEGGVDLSDIIELLRTMAATA
jgi:hypothetical protein